MRWGEGWRAEGGWFQICSERATQLWWGRGGEPLQGSFWGVTFGNPGWRPPYGGLILGCDGLWPDRGLFAGDAEGARVSATMLRNASWRCVLADSDKIERTAPVRYAELSEIDLLITDDGIDPNDLSRLREVVKEVQVVTLHAKDQQS